MTEAEWLACEDLDGMRWFLSGNYTGRKVWLFGSACCRSVWHRLHDARSRGAVETAERYADGNADAEQLAEARAAAELVCSGGRPFRPGAVAAFALILAPEWQPDRWPSAASVAQHGVWAAADLAEVSGKNRKERKLRCLDGAAAEHARHCALLREGVGNPFSTPSFDHIQRTPVVTILAQAAYEERILPGGHLDNARLAVLSDALEEAGCADADILTHLRSPGPHVRGC